MGLAARESFTQDPSRYQMAVLAGLMARERREENAMISARAQATEDRMEYMLDRLHQIIDSRSYARRQARLAARREENLGADVIDWLGDEPDDLLGDIDQEFDFGEMLANQEQYMETPE